jgi:hypothetical protein
MTMANTPNRSAQSRWLLRLLFFAFYTGIATAQTCNPNAESSFTSWTNGGSTITDNTTGLTWQRCALGQAWTGSSCGGTATTAAWAAAVSGAPAGWRLPNVKELESMVERRCAAPAADGAAFPAAPSVNFWSSTLGWAVNFNDGSVLSGQGVATSLAVRYVQGGDAATFNNFDAGLGTATNCAPNVPQDRLPSQWTVNADDTLTDQTTRLTWRRCAEGMIYAAGRCASFSTFNTYSWQQALAVPGQVGNGGWRVPNVKELESLIDRSCANPAVGGSRFPDQPAVDFWSSTPGWAVSFNDGAVLSGQSYSATKAVRLVKGGAAVNTFTTGSGGAGNCTTQAPTDFKLIEWLENADGTLYDSGTGMTWDRCVLGQTWSAIAGACTGTPEALTWAAGLQRANVAYFGGRNGWRVPNVKELESIVDRRCQSPALNPDFFRGNQETLTWSGTPGWAVNMVDGSVLSGQAASSTMAVRLVRGGLGATAFDQRVGGVPGAVLAGPNSVEVIYLSPNLLLPTVTNQKLIFLTHGWNANSVEESAWPRVMLETLCARLSAAVSSAGAAAVNQVGVSAYCDTPAWRVVAFNWGPLARDRPLGTLASGVPNGLPWSALAQARNMGELVGQTLVNGANQYSFVHMVGHSAGSNLLHEFGRQLKLANATAPKIHATFLDAFCGYPDRCDYGYWSDWADSYIDTNKVFALEGRETRMTLCNAANFDVTATYSDPVVPPSAGNPNGFSSPVEQWTARHAWPYLCYADSTATGGLGVPGYNVACLGSGPSDVGFGLSYLGAGSTNVGALLGARTLSYPKGRMYRQTGVSAFSIDADAKCGVSALQAVANAVTSTIGNVTSTVGNVIGTGVPALTSTCALPTYTPATGFSTTAQLATCSQTSLKSLSTQSPTSVENVTAWSALSLNVGRRANQLRFSLQFTAPADGLLSVYVDDQPVYSTTRAVRGAAVYDTGFFDVTAMERGAHAVSFRLDALESTSAAVSVSAIQVGAVALCDLDMDGDGAMTVARDGALLLRYLMGFRGAALTDGLGVANVNVAQEIADYVGSAVQFDVFGRNNPVPLATTDGLLLLRLMLGMPDADLLNGIGAPVGALFSTSETVRANVNGKCGTRF